MRNINPEWLIDNFLPDVEEKWSTFINNLSPKQICHTSPEQLFLEEYFEEALRSFALTQKKICAESAHFDDELLRGSCGLGCDYYEIDRDSILEADFPEPINI